MNLSEYYKKADSVLGVAKILFSSLFDVYPSKPISEIAGSSSGGTPNRGNAEYYGGNIPWLKSGELNESYITESNEFITKKGLENSSAKLFPKGTLLVAMYGATAGRTGILKIDAATNQAVCALFPKKDIKRDFLYWFLRQHRIDFIIQSKGGAQPNISQKVIKETHVPLPPIEIQEKVVAFLNDVNLNGFIDSESTVVDDIVIDQINRFYKIINVQRELNDKFCNQKALLENLKQSILQDAIQGELTKAWRKENPTVEPASELLKRIKAEKAQLIKEKKIKKEKPLPAITNEEIPFELPEGWNWCRLGEIYQTTSGGTPLRSNSEYWNGEIKWYKSGELNDGLLSNNSSEYITEKGLKESSATLFPSGTLLIAMYGATAGKLAILSNEATTNQAVCGFYNNSNTSTDFLFYYLRANRSKMIDESWGMSQPNISQTYLRNFVFVLPPFEEQKAIVQKVETLMQKCTALEQEIAQSEANADMLMQAVLKEAFEKKEVKEVEGYEEVEYNYVNK